MLTMKVKVGRRFLGVAGMRLHWSVAAREDWQPGNLEHTPCISRYPFSAPNTAVYASILQIPVELCLLHH